MYELKGTMYELEALSATDLHRLVAGGVTTVIVPFGSIVMLALRPELVDVRAAADDLADELQAASADRGAEHLEQFVAAIVESVRAEAVAVGLSGWWRRLGRSAGRPRSRL